MPTLIVQPPRGCDVGGELLEFIFHDEPRVGHCLLFSPVIGQTVREPVAPSMSLMEDATSPLTASRPKKNPATAMAMTMMGPSEKTE
jgi:hypothetical protein